jgi:hypothetical protein
VPGLFQGPGSGLRVENGCCRAVLRVNPGRYRPTAVVGAGPACGAGGRRSALQCLGPRRASPGKWAIDAIDAFAAQPGKAKRTEPTNSCSSRSSPVSSGTRWPPPGQRPASAAPMAKRFGRSDLLQTEIEQPRSLLVRMSRFGEVALHPQGGPPLVDSPAVRPNRVTPRSVRNSCDGPERRCYRLRRGGRPLRMPGRNRPPAIEPVAGWQSGARCDPEEDFAAPGEPGPPPVAR